MSSHSSTVLIPSEFLLLLKKLLIAPGGPTRLEVGGGFLGGSPSRGPVITCTGVAILVEAIPAGGHTLAMLHQQGALAGRAPQPTGTCRALRLAGWSRTRLEEEKGKLWLAQRHHHSVDSYIAQVWGSGDRQAKNGKEITLPDFTYIARIMPGAVWSTLHIWMRLIFTITLWGRYC